jgi:hypothetical protein
MLAVDQKTSKLNDMKDPRLGRLVEFDKRSRGFAAVDRGGFPMGSRHWECDWILDQGREGACVGFSLVHHLRATPIVWDRRTGIPAATHAARRLYQNAKKVDKWPGENYSGTSILAGCRTLKRGGHISGYRWCFGYKDVLVAVAEQGPVVLGINWYESMYEPDRGRIEVAGEVAGGHAILCNGVDHLNRTVTLHNSWGPDWGDNGEAALSWDDLDLLLSQSGEAVSLVD